MAKRGRGEGTAYERRDGRWVGVLTVGWAGGRQKRKYLYGATQKEVLDKLDEARQRQRLGVSIDSGRQTVETWLTTWLENQKPPALKFKTYTSYEGLCRVHLIPALGRKLLSKLQPEDVRKFMREKAAAGLSPKTIRHLRATLRCALNVALQDGLIHRNVAALAKPPRLPKAPQRVFTPELARKFLDAVEGHRLEALFTVALSVGLREGEALGLRWADVDLGSGKLTVNYTLQRVKDGANKSALTLVEPKTDKSRRVIALPQVAVSALAAHGSRQEAERAACGSQWKETGMVFTTRVGTMLDPRNMLRDFYAVLNTPDASDPEPDPKKKRKLLPRLRFHDLRHSAATLLLVQGVHPRYIMDLFGHSTISLTMNTYGHVLESMRRETADRMDAVLAPVDVREDVKPPTAALN